MKKTVYVCDRCGRERDCRTAFLPDGGLNIDPAGGSSSPSGTELDLCFDCACVAAVHAFKCTEFSAKYLAGCKHKGR